MGKILLGVVELPNDIKTIDYSVLLVFSAVFYLAAFILKNVKEGSSLFKALLSVYLRMFLIWIVACLVMIFSFSLSHELGWNLLETISLTACQLFSTSTLVVVCHWRFISKAEFIVY